MLFSIQGQGSLTEMIQQYQGYNSKFEISLYSMLPFDDVHIEYNCNGSSSE